MGQVSKKLALRLKKSRKLTDELRREAKPIQAALDALQRGGPPWPPDDDLHPLHAVYIAVQNVSSFFAERVSVFPEFKDYYQIVARAEEEYLPSSPPMSPLTRSYFTTWAFYDVRFGADRETIGTCLMDVGDLLGLEPGSVEAIRLMNESRMGIYERGASSGGRCRFRELITDDEFESYVPVGYPGGKGDLWYVRLCPPIRPLAYHVALTTPYILLGFGKSDWTAYLSKSLIGLTAPEKRRRLHELLKHGREPNQWNEFIFKAYHHHQFDAIFLTGLPDVRGSLPHA